MEAASQGHLPKVEQKYWQLIKNEDLVRDIADKVTCAVCVDISDKEMMNNIGLEGMDAVVIATAEHLDSSVMALMIVKEIGVPYVLAKADGTLKGEILKTCWSR